eukprot:TRINITY_DN67361_c0_g1_i1.p1 TRINITY_DN67361_c0_g1~~TRINITY_DN67361_c0_g1_i1.p1  ORF type:complete len:835 (-),score=142.37 TRINITY_DN67361_c0_g1_i1:112-2616(-)
MERFKGWVPFGQDDAIGEDGGMVDLPLFNLEVLRDEKDATVAFVFTREESVGGSINPDEIIEEPFESAKCIFVRKTCKESQATMDTGFEALRAGDVKASVYQEVIRAKLVELLTNHGFKLETALTLDNDEIIMKICVPRDGEILATWAHNNHYLVPVKPQMYKDMPPEGHFYPGGDMPKNVDGVSVPAYVEYDATFAEEHAGMLEPFKEVDEIRLIMMHLDHYVNVSELVDQNIISRLFYCSKYNTLIHMYAHWAKMSNFWHIPSYQDDDMLRDYFGEQITFKFLFLAYFIRAMGVLGVFGVICHVLVLPPFVEMFGFTAANRDSIKLSYVVVNILWAACFMLLWKAYVKRRRQRWGMEDAAHTVNMELPNYDPDLEGTKELGWRRSVVRFATPCFMILFVVGVGGIQAYRRVAKESGLQDFSALLMTAWMQGGMFVWGKLCIVFVTMENHRTELRWYDSLSQCLALIKMFIAIWPGFEKSFIAKWINEECGPTRDAVLFKVYEKIGWPVGVVVNVVKQGNQTIISDSSWADPFMYVNSANETCMYGCFPVECSLVGVDKVQYCETSCVVEYKSVLQTFFIVQVACIIIFIIIPMVLVKFVIHREVVKAAEMHQDGTAEKPYTLLELQAKRQELCPYEYKSWGASYVEDFVAVATTFTVVVCYGQLDSVVVLIGFLSHLLVYRLIASRMLLVTGRPFPAGSGGIGFWEDAFDVACNIGILINIGLLCFVVMPFRDWDLAEQLLLFLTLEHFVIAMRALVDQLIKGDPDDVRLTRDVNNTFLKKMEVYDVLRVYDDERYNYDDAHASLGLPPPNPKYAKFDEEDEKGETHASGSA